MAPKVGAPAAARQRKPADLSGGECGLLVGFSRCYLGVHYPGCLLAGWILAVVGLWAGALLGL
ncbi:MAG: hypothetical protein KY466_13355 [Gemmatimonadetes bacterium]|nr:hypothetical protein [Gemmatimonadota bacterium]